MRMVLGTMKTYLQSALDHLANGATTYEIDLMDPETGALIVSGGTKILAKLLTIELMIQEIAPHLAASPVVSPQPESRKRKVDDGGSDIAVNLKRPKLTVTASAKGATKTIKYVNKSFYEAREYIKDAGQYEIGPSRLKLNSNVVINSKPTVSSESDDEGDDTFAPDIGGSFPQYAPLPAKRMTKREALAATKKAEKLAAKGGAILKRNKAVEAKEQRAHDAIWCRRRPRAYEIPCPPEVSAFTWEHMSLSSQEARLRGIAAMKEVIEEGWLSESSNDEDWE